MTEIEYWIYDGRYYSEPERAFLLSACTSLKEAKKERHDYGEGNAIVKVTIVDNVVTEKELVL